MTTTNQTTAQKSIFDQFVLVDLNFKSYSATISLSKTGLLEKDVPKDLVTSGHLKLVDPARLKAFATLRAQARSACLKVGTGYMSLYMIPVKHWERLKDELQNIVIKFNDEAISFRDNYSTYVEEFAQKADSNGNHRIAAAMRACQHEKSWVASRFSATFGAGFFTHAPGMDTESADNAVKETLRDNILGDIATLSGNAVRGYANGTSAITRRLVTSTLQGVIDKLEGLSFVDQSLEVLKETLIKYAAAFELPEKGNLPTTKQSQIATLFLTMKDPDNFTDLAQILKKQIEDLRPPVEAAPAVETATAVEAAPAVETAPAVEAAPVVKTAPAVEAAPAVEMASAVEAAPAVEMASAVEAAPAVEMAPAVEAVPAVETALAVEAVPTLDLSGIQIEVEEDDDFGFMV